jgi:hypothetical protein
MVSMSFKFLPGAETQRLKALTALEISGLSDPPSIGGRVDF